MLIIELLKPQRKRLKVRFWVQLAHEKKFSYVTKIAAPQNKALIEELKSLKELYKSQN